MDCRNCKKLLDTKEITAYKSLCEDCWANRDLADGPPGGTGIKHPSNYFAQASRTDRHIPSDKEEE